MNVTFRYGHVNDLANVKAKDELISEMLEALLQCHEYLKFSLGSTSDINPYPAMETAIAKAEASQAEKRA